MFGFDYDRLLPYDTVGGGCGGGGGQCGRGATRGGLGRLTL